MNSEGCPEGEARGTSRGIHRPAWVFYIGLVFFLKSKEIYHSVPKYGGKEYKFLHWVWRTGISIGYKFHPWVCRTGISISWKLFYKHLINWNPSIIVLRSSLLKQSTWTHSEFFYIVFQSLYTVQHFIQYLIQWNFIHQTKYLPLAAQIRHNLPIWTDI